MKLRPVYAIIYRYASLLRAHPMRLFGLYIWTLIDMTLWGFISSYIDRIAPPGFNALSVFLGAVVMVNFFSRVMLNINMAFFEDMYARNFINVFASPIRISQYLLGLVCCGVMTSTVGVILSLTLAHLFFGFSIFVYGLPLAAFLMILFLFGIALGIAGCAIVLARGPSSEWLIWSLPAIISPFVGVYYPIETLPYWMQSIARLLPPSYVFEGARHAVEGKPVDGGSLALGGCLALIYMILTSIIFLRVYRKAMRTGLIARYSAENAN